MTAPAVKTASRAALIAAFATIYIVWGSTYLGMRVGVETMPPLAMAGARFFLAGIILFTFVRVRAGRGAPWPTAEQWRANAIVGGLLLLCGNGLVMWAEQFIPSGVASLIIAVAPMFMVLIEWAFPGGRRPGPYTTFGLAVGFAGIVVLAEPWHHINDGTELPLKGVIAIICSSFFWALGSIFSRHVRNPAPAFSASAMQMLCGGAGLMIAAVIRGERAMIHLSAISGRSWLAFAYLVLVGSLVGYSTYAWLLKNSTPARISTYAYVNPVVAVFLGWLILDEPITRRTLLAAAIILTAVVIIIVRKNKRAA